MSADGLITVSSSYDPATTMHRLEEQVNAHNMTIFAHIDHAAGAAEAGMQLRPTDLLIFGTAKSGTALMQSVQSIGIDLPLKALVWQDQAGRTFVSYNEPHYLTRRHKLGDSAKPVATAMSNVLKEMVEKATTAP